MKRVYISADFGYVIIEFEDGRYAYSRINPKEFSDEECWAFTPRYGDILIWEKEVQSEGYSGV